MKILVCIAKTPDTTASINFKNDNKEFDSNNISYIINPYDEWYSLVRALELKEEGKVDNVTLINVGPADNDAILRKALAIGGDEAVRIESDSYLDSTALGTEIAEYAKQFGFDLVFTGKESIDYNNGSVGGAIAACMDSNFIPMVTSFDLQGDKAIIEHNIEGGTEKLELNAKCVISAQKGLAEQRIPNMRGIMAARTKPLTIIDDRLPESKTEIISYEKPPAKSGVKMYTMDNLEDLVKDLAEQTNLI